MRVVAGSLRGRKLEAPPGLQTRPITDRVKETLFNILGARFGVPGTLPAFDVLDLFAGSGGLGIEALSRGARSCLFVERHRRSLRALRHNLAVLGLDASARVSGENAWTLRVPPAPGEGYGLVFVDPPYRDVGDLLGVVDLLERVAAHLAPEGVIVFRHERRTCFPVEALYRLRCVDERKLGTMRVWLFSRAESPAAGGAGPQ